MTCKNDMDPRHGLGFFVVGLFMWLLPAMAPHAFPAPSFGGMNGRAMWLEGMGIIQILFGGTIVLRYSAWPAVQRWATTAKPASAAPVFARTKRPLPV
jgi:hypothetical protein